MTRTQLRKVFSILFSIIFLFTTILPAFAATAIDPALEWRTIETPHFSIHYYPAEASAAQRVASFMEDVHTNLLNVIKKEPEGKTNIVLLDNTDISNGLTTTFPYKAITLYTKPMGFTLSGFSGYEEWLKMVAIHEYLHILHMDRTEGETQIVRMIFGNAAVVYDLLQPSWSQEGLATYTETRFTTGGRGVDPFVDMELRSQFIEGQELASEQTGGYTSTRRMPGANYLYGVKLWQYIAATYGEDKLDRITQYFAQEPLLGFGVAVKKATGDSLDTIWERFIVSMRDKYNKQAAQIISQGLTGSTQLTHTQYSDNKYPRWGINGKFIYYYAGSLDSEPKLMRYDPVTAKSEEVLEKSALFSSFGISNGGNIVYSQLNPYKNYYLYYDLYSYDTKTKQTKQLTKGARAIYPAVSPDGKKIAYTTSSGSMGSIVIVEDGKSRNLVPPNDAIFESPVFSPDGNNIAVASSLNGYTEICIIDMTGNITPIFNNMSRTANVTPSWSPDGRYIIFSSDRSGVYNIYAYDLQQAKLYQVTNVLTGAAMPAVSPDGKKIAFSQYSYLGWDIHVMDYNPASWREVPVIVTDPALPGEQVRVDSLLSASESKEVKTFESHPYNPLPTLMPAWWAPIPVFDGAGYGPGLMTFNNDVLGKHSYSVMAGTGLSGRLIYDVSYVNDQLPPSITLNISDSANWVQRHEAKSVKISYQYNIDMDTAQLFSIGYASDNITNISFTTATPGILSGIQLGYAYSHLHRYYNSISNEEGYTLGLSASVNSKNMGSTLNTTIYTADSKVYFPLSDDHKVLAVRATAVTTAGEPMSIYNYTMFLRGYPYGYLAGGTLWRGTAEYRFPISYIEAGPKKYPFNLIYLDRAWGALFSDIGEASGNFVYIPGIKTSAGAQLNVDTYIRYNIPVTFSVYYAYGFNDNTGSQFGFSITTPYIAGGW